MLKKGLFSILKFCMCLFVFQEAMRRRDAASLAAAEALKEASAAESVVRSLRYCVNQRTRFYPSHLPLLYAKPEGIL